jgi:UDP-N-acetylmuramate: L-alanyl-gamma-D-glutamyl-meso-diaminopimelate ligase
MKIYLMGIGGTGMASLAGMLKASGHEVRGSDKGIYPPMSLLLEEFGVPVASPYDAKNLSPTPDLVVIGNVISRDHPEAQAVLAQHIPYDSMAETIRRFFLQGKTSLVVAGTHGKTTATALLAWVLESAARDPGFFIGGRPRNFPQNFQLGAGEFFVLEGDEYDTAFFDKGPKFLHYEPRHVLLTSIEFDHADIYQNLEQILVSFKKLLELIPANGSLVANLDFPEVGALMKKFSGKTVSYTMDPQKKSRADYFAEILQTSPKIKFRISTSRGESLEINWEMIGTHNVSNAVGVAALARGIGLSWEEIRKGIETFKGVARRQELLGVPGGVTVLDDFAHHPTAVRVTLEAVRQRYPKARLWALFEPRSNTTKRDVFQKDYAQAFDSADFVLMDDVFQPEKVKDGKVLDMERLAVDITARGRARARHLSGIDPILQTLRSELQPGDVVLIMSNGDFRGLGPKLMKILAEKPGSTLKEK